MLIEAGRPDPSTNFSILVSPGYLQPFPTLVKNICELSLFALLPTKSVKDTMKVAAALILTTSTVAAFAPATFGVRCK
jgi:hypothetical protein